MNKAKATSMDVIVRMIDDKPYYELKYMLIGENYYHVGYSSFDLQNVLKWRDECFEYVGEKMTNADKIRSMSDEELAVFLCKVKADYQWIDQEYPSEEECGSWEEWLQSEAETQP